MTTAWCNKRSSMDAAVVWIPKGGQLASRAEDAAFWRGLVSGETTAWRRQHFVSSLGRSAFERMDSERLVETSEAVGHLLMRVVA